MTKKIFILLLAFCITPLFAHECWIAAQKFVLEKGTTAKLSLHVGENFEPEIWKGSLVALQYFWEKKQKNILSLLKDTVNQQFELPLEGEGTQLVALNSTDKYIRLEPEKFNDYLKEDGLLDVLEFRKKNNQLDSFGTELYQRCNKILLQVGTKRTNIYSKVVGTRLEIIPQQNPYIQPKNLTVKILFDGKPSERSQVVMWQKINGKTQKVNQWTDKNGLVTFQPDYTANCMISTVKMVANDNPKKAQWHSYWANLTFGL
ncbi:MAG: DUF4198 domain-containing protein [Thermoflexibacteraceae bacterium]|jgi:uncharacterized GH25 family protein